jgi:hypothetical protein
VHAWRIESEQGAWAVPCRRSGATNRCGPRTACATRRGRASCSRPCPCPQSPPPTPPGCTYSCTVREAQRLFILAGMGRRTQVRGVSPHSDTDTSRACGRIATPRGPGPHVIPPAPAPRPGVPKQKDGDLTLSRFGSHGQGAYWGSFCSASSWILKYSSEDMNPSLSRSARPKISWPDHEKPLYGSCRGFASQKNHSSAKSTSLRVPRAADQAPPGC